MTATTQAKTLYHCKYGATEREHSLHPSCPELFPSIQACREHETVCKYRLVRCPFSQRVVEATDRHGRVLQHCKPLCQELVPVLQLSDHVQVCPSRLAMQYSAAKRVYGVDCRPVTLLLDVGGQRFRTTRETLCRAPSSVLPLFENDEIFRALPRYPEHILSGGNYGSPHKEGEVIFLDMDPDEFASILKKLRRSIPVPFTCVSPPDPSDVTARTQFTGDVQAAIDINTVASKAHFRKDDTEKKELWLDCTSSNLRTNSQNLQRRNSLQHGVFPEQGPRTDGVYYERQEERVNGPGILLHFMVDKTVMVYRKTHNTDSDEARANARRSVTRVPRSDSHPALVCVEEYDKYTYTYMSEQDVINVKSVSYDGTIRIVRNLDGAISCIVCDNSTLYFYAFTKAQSRHKPHTGYLGTIWIPRKMITSRRCELQQTPSGSFFIDSCLCPDKDDKYMYRLERYTRDEDNNCIATTPLTQRHDDFYFTESFLLARQSIVTRRGKHVYVCSLLFHE